MLDRIGKYEKVLQLYINRLQIQYFKQGIYQKLLEQGYICCLIKGFAYESLLNLKNRIFTDIDLLVKDREYSEIHKIFIEEGYQIQDLNIPYSNDKKIIKTMSNRSHKLTYVKNITNQIKIYVEVHTGIHPWQDMEVLLDSCQFKDGFYMLTPIDQWIVACVHLLHHAYTDGLRTMSDTYQDSVRHYNDVECGLLYLMKTENKETILKRIHELHAENFCVEALTYIERILEINTPLSIRKKYTIYLDWKIEGNLLRYEDRFLYKKAAKEFLIQKVKKVKEPQDIIFHTSNRKEKWFSFESDQPTLNGLCEHHYARTGIVYEKKEMKFKIEWDEHGIFVEQAPFSGILSHKNDFERFSTFYCIAISKNGEEKRFFFQPKFDNRVVIYQHIKEERIDYYHKISEEICENSWTGHIPMKIAKEDLLFLDISYQIKRNASELEELAWISGNLRNCRPRENDEISPYMEGNEIYPPLYIQLKCCDSISLETEGK